LEAVIGMELVVKRSDFLNELQLMQGVVERKNTIPILSNILLRADDGHLNLTSTDLDLTLLSRAGARIQSPGSVTVLARNLFEIVRLLPEEDVKLELLENHYLGVSCGTGKYRLVAQPAEDFPTVPQVEGRGGLKLPLGLFKQMIRKVMFAISAEETRFQLMGALLKAVGKDLELVATDGHRLALIDFANPGKASIPPVLVPKKAMAELLKMDGGAEAEIEIHHSENHLAFTCGDRKLIARLLDVNFPDYEKVISRDNDKTVLVSRAALQATVKRVSLFSSERSRGVRLAFEPDRLTVSSVSQELGEGTETLEIDYKGETLTTGLNAQYLLDFLAEAETETVRLDLKDENTQCLCRPEGEIEGSSRYLYVVMPMRM
jgi:DNA polymerase III subunit beta